MALAGFAVASIEQCDGSRNARARVAERGGEGVNCFGGVLPRQFLCAPGILVEMQRLTELIDRASARLDAMLSDSDPATLAAAADEFARQAKEIQAAGAG